MTSRSVLQPIAAIVLRPEAGEIVAYAQLACTHMVQIGVDTKDGRPLSAVGEPVACWHCAGEREPWGVVDGGYGRLEFGWPSSLGPAPTIHLTTMYPFAQAVVRASDGRMAVYFAPPYEDVVIVDGDHFEGARAERLRAAVTHFSKPVGAVM